MTKRTFLEMLAQRLAMLPVSEREETISYYSELIEDMLEDGLSEQEAVSRLEDIDLIVGRILGEHGAERQTTPEPKKSSGCFKAFLIAAVTLLIVTLVLSYAGVAVVGKVFDGLQIRNTPESGELQLEEEKVTSSVDISEKGVEIRTDDFELSISAEDGIHMTGQLPEKWSDWQEGLDQLDKWQDNGTPTALTEAHTLCDLPAKGIRGLSIEWVSASVDICTHAKDTVLAVEYAASPLNNEQVGLARQEGGELEIDFDNERNQGRYPDKKLVVYLPEGLALNELTVEAASADITVTGIDGRELEIDTASGDIIVEGIWADCSIDSASGGVILAPGSDFTLRFESSSGSLNSGDHVLTQQGKVWVAGNGTNHIEVDTASGGLILK